MITDGTKWHNLAVKTLSGLLRGITGNNHGNFYYLKCLHSYTTKNRLNKHQKICENHEYCKLEMPKKESVLRYIFGEKSIMTPFVIYADLESILEKISGCENDPEKSSTIKVNKHVASGYSLFSHCLFDKTKNKLDHYIGQKCMKNFSLNLREHGEKIINYEQAKIIALTKEEWKQHRSQKVCYICKRVFSTDDNNNNYHKIKDHCYYTGRYSGAADVVCGKKCKIPKEIPVIFHNGSTYFHFIIKELAEEFKGKFECLGENTEKYITFSVPIEKECDDGKPIVYKIKFIDSFRFVSTSLYSLVDSLSDGLYNIQCKDCNSFLDYMNFYDDKLVHRCFDCKTNYNINFNNKLIDVFSNTYNFCGGDINKYILLLRKRVYPYEYMDSFERFSETLSDKNAFYSNFNMESITDIDYRHAKDVFNKFNNNNLGDYHDLYVQSNTLLLADVFTNFSKVCFDIYELDPAHFLSAPGLAWQACLKKSNVELELISDVDMLLMFEKRIRGGITQAACRYYQSNNRYMGKKYDKTKKSTYHQYYDANNLCAWAMTQTFPVDCFEWEKPS